MTAVVHEQRGSGRPVVLLHGFCETRKLWYRMADKLAGSYAVFLPDLPGFGESPLPHKPFSIESIAAMIHAWLDENGLHRPVVIGHSLGGYVALAMAATQPFRMSGLGLFHSTAYADTAEKKANRDKVIDFVTRNGVAPYVETFVPGLFFQKDHPDIATMLKIGMGTRKETLIAYATAMRDRPDRTGILETFSGPMLMVAGDHDAGIPVEQTAKQVALMRTAVFRVLNNTGHMGMFESELESMKIVKEFIDLVATSDSQNV